MQKHLVAVAVGALAATNLFAAPVTVQSPDGQVAASFEVENGELFYSVSKGGKPVVGSSQGGDLCGCENGGGRTIHPR